MSGINLLLLQLLKMAIYVLAGYILYRRRVINKEGSRSLAGILLYLALPSVILRSYCLEWTDGLVQTVLLSMAVAAAALIVSMFFSKMVFHRLPIDEFGAAFSNAGFIGVPLVSGALGKEALVFTVGFIALLNVLQWTYGQGILTGDRRISLKKLIHPIPVSFILGLLLMVTGIRINSTIYSCIDGFAEMNTPLAMTILGVYLAQTDMKEVFCRGRSYKVCIVRLVCIPILTILILTVLPQQYLTMKQSLLIAASAPIGVNVAVYVERLNKEYVYAAQIVCLSTLLSVFTIPLLMILSNYLWGI